MGPGTLASRIEQIAGFTRLHRAYRLDPAAVGLFSAVRDLFGSSVGRWYIARQRLINVFVTNMVGPSEPLSMLGAEVLDIVPVAPISGNVPIAIGVLSYAGTLTVSVNADPEALPDLEAFVAGLRHAMAERRAGNRPLLVKAQPRSACWPSRRTLDRPRSPRSGAR
jgi:hypothetical protein